MRDYQQARLLTMLNPEADPNGAGYQIIQAQKAVNRRRRCAARV